MAEAIFRVRPELAGINTFQNRMLAALRGVNVETRRLSTSAARVRLQFAQGLINRTRLRQETAELRLAQAQLRQMGQATRGLRTALTGTVTKLLALAGGVLLARRMARSFSDAAKAGVRLNREFEAMQVGVAATLAANTKIINVQGKQLQGLDAIVAAQFTSRNIQQDILSITLETGGTLDTTLSAFRIALPLLLQQKATFQDTLDVVKRLNLAAIAIGIPIDLVRLQIDDIARGVITARTTLARVLGITQSELRLARQRSEIVKLVQERTQAFVDAQDILLGKFAAASNRVKALGQNILQIATRGGFDLLRDAMNQIIKSFVIFDEKTKRFKGFRPEVLTIANSLGAAFTAFVKAVVLGSPLIVRSLASVLKIAGLIAKAISYAEEGFQRLKIVGSDVQAAAARRDVEVTERFLERAEKRQDRRAVDRLRLRLERQRRVLELAERDTARSLGRVVEAEQFRKAIDTTVKQATSGFTLIADEFKKKIVPLAKQFEFKPFVPLPVAEIERLTDQALKSVIPLAKKFFEVTAKDKAGVLNELRTVIDALPEQVQPRVLEALKAQFRFEASDILSEDEVKELQKRWEATLKKLEASTRKRGIGNFFQQFGDSLGRALKKQKELNSAIGGLNNLLPDLDKRIVAALGDLQKGGNAAIGIFGDISDAARRLGQVLDKTIREQVGDALRSIAEDIGDSFGRIFEEIVAGTRSLSESLKNIFRSLVGSIIATFFRRLITAAINELLQGLQGALAGIITGKGGKPGILGKILGVILDIKDPKKATQDNTAKTALNTEATDRNTAAINLLTQAIRVGGGGPGTAGPFGSFLPLFFGGRGGGQGGGGIFGGIFSAFQGLFGGIKNIFSDIKRAFSPTNFSFAKGGAIGIGNIVKGIGGVAGIPLLLQSLSTGGTLGTGLGIAGGALTGFAFGGPIGAAVGAAAGGLLAGVIGGAQRREAKRVRAVQEAIRRQTVAPLLESKAFQFANAPTIGGILGSTILERPGPNRFLRVPQEEAPLTSPAMVVNGPLVTIDALDAASFEGREDILRVIEGRVEGSVTQALSNSGRLVTRVGEIANVRRM
jgi:hypothetical protein